MVVHEQAEPRRGRGGLIVINVFDLILTLVEVTPTPCGASGSGWEGTGLSCCEGTEGASGSFDAGPNLDVLFLCDYTCPFPSVSWAPAVG